MQAGKRYTLWQLINWQRKYLFIFLVLDSIPVILYYFTDHSWIPIPWQPLSLIGIAVAFYLGFKNNSSYERLWEARKIWGGIVNESRSITIMFRDFVTNEYAKEPQPEETLFTITKRLVHRHIAWMYALTFQLRKLQEWEHDDKRNSRFRTYLGLNYSETQFDELAKFLSEADLKYIKQKGNKASHLLSLQSADIKQLKFQGLVDDFRHMEIVSKISRLYELQGQSERIKNFPFPRQYATANFFFVCTFLFLLPFGMLSIFNGFADGTMIWLSIPFSILCSMVFWTMEMIGEYSENPFEGLYNDVPITSMARSIEIDIRQMLEETDLPEPMKPLGPFRMLW
ncbi:bestrophin family protein [Marinoscillum sp. MHG1-6]|uniref:bestrophin family protein n=1 Tax=Marinoscillum sp. MHG1-6 TaxID=2959627 RepID=UPI00215845D5|nr:bestrophin family ion channel [Marinoscillum sp. MHG1-6]